MLDKNSTAKERLLQEVTAILGNKLEVNLLKPGEKGYRQAEPRRTRRMPIIQAHVAQGGNIGFCPSGKLIIVDVDCKPGGANGWASVAKLNLPPTRTVRTPTGEGCHFYFAIPPGTVVRRHIPDCPGIDILSGNMNVVVPGSLITNGVTGEYTLDDDRTEIAQCPAHLLELIRDEVAEEECSEDYERASVSRMKMELPDYTVWTDGIEMFEPWEHHTPWLEVGMAIHYETGGSQEGLDFWLAWSQQCPEKYHEQKLINRWHSFHDDRHDGVRWGTIRLRIREQPVAFDVLPKVTAGVTKGNTGKWGDLGENFRPTVDTVVEEPVEDDWGLVRVDDGHSEERACGRTSLYGGFLYRGHASLTVGPGGAGKSVLSLVEGVSMACGRDLAKEGTPMIPSRRVLVINNEDDQNELRLRIQAIMKWYGVSDADVGGRLIYKSGYNKPVKLACTRVRDRKEVVEDHPDVKKLVQVIQQNQIDVLIMDPLVSLHDCQENDNVSMDSVVGVIKKLAHDLDIAIHITHHTSKAGTSDDPDRAGRGASSIKDAMRATRYVGPMTADQCKGTSIDPKDRFRYFQVVPGKINFAPRVGDGNWFQFWEQELDVIPFEIGAPEIERVGVPGPTESPVQKMEESEKMTAQERTLTCLGRCADEQERTWPIPFKEAVEIVTEALGMTEKTAQNHLAQLKKAPEIGVEIGGFLYWKRPVGTNTRDGSEVHRRKAQEE